MRSHAGNDRRDLQRPSPWRRASCLTPCGLAGLLALLVVIGPAFGADQPASEQPSDKSGLGPSKLKLPKGPGSLEGIGENAEPNVNMGLMAYGIAIPVPQGFPGATPSLRLSYSSGAGASIVGMGWSLSIPSIERMTSFGLPTYDAIAGNPQASADLFAANGGDELVQIPGTNTWRARRESGFVRYTWAHASGTWRRGVWRAEYPDGRTAYFGNGKTGFDASSASPLDAAVVQAPGGVFRWQIVEAVDVLGHRIRYDYENDGGTPLLRRISYEPRYEVRFEYEPRPDELSDARPGSDVRQKQRLRTISVSARGTDIDQWVLDYEPEEESGGLSRLTSVTRYGLHGNAYPIRFRFAYTGSTSGCDQPYCQQPSFFEMGSAGTGFAAGLSDLIDLNGDGLPDVLDTTAGKHGILVNRFLPDGSHGFSAAKPSALTGSGAALLSAPLVELVDLNGDGFSDLIDGANHYVYWNQGGGDWASQADLDLGLPSGFGQGSNYRFFDVDSDRRPDILFSERDAAWVHMARPEGGFEASETPIEAIGYSFVTDGLQMADMNGDGLQDPVVRYLGAVSYRLNLGRGAFSPGWIEMLGLPLDLPENEARFVDMNGDGLSDVLWLTSGRLAYALNRDGRGFGPLVDLLAGDDVQVPSLDPATQVRLADMNGNGSTDVVWIDASGHLSYLDLFPVRAHLLTRIENGLGKIIEVTYGSSTGHLNDPSDPQPWARRLPNPMATVDRIDAWDTLSGRHQVQRLHYRDGAYDGVEHQFRGFGEAVVTLDGDGGTEEGQTRYRFHVGDPDPQVEGDEDPYLAGTLLEQETLSDGESIESVFHDYEGYAQRCPVAEVPGTTTKAVRFVCEGGTTRVVRERSTDAADEVSIDESYTYDGYGNRTKTARHGVTAIGGAGCPACDLADDAWSGPCGADCLHDEAVEETTFVEPGAHTGGRWILNKPVSKRSYGRAGGPVAEQRFYYDGSAFQGLAQGDLTLGLPTRTQALVSPGTWVDTERNRFDDDGNVVEVKDANGHGRSFEYDADGLLVTAEVVHLDDPATGHAPYHLRLEAAYHPLFDLPVETSDWRYVGANGDVTPAVVTRYAYDEFRRLTAIARPGDALDLPTQEFRYELADPVSRIVTLGRSTSGGPTDLEAVQCFDGQGRKVQERTKIAAGSYQVSGFTEFTRADKPWRVWQPYLRPSAACDVEPPLNARVTEQRYDATGRLVSTTLPDADERGGVASITSTRYLPLAEEAWDENDNDPQSAHADTPTTTKKDGLGRTTAVLRRLSPTDAPIVLRYTYDDLGHLQGYVDEAGNRKLQTYDLVGRIVKVDDPDSGVTIFAYDGAGNKVAQTDARGVTLAYAYDETNRTLGEWDAADREGSLTAFQFDARDDCPSSLCPHLPGRVAHVTWTSDGSDGEDLYGYDARGQQTGLTRRIEHVTLSFSTSYDNAGRLVAKGYPANRTVLYDLDAAGRTIAVPDFVDALEYTDQGDLAAMHLSNGVETTYGYDARRRTVAIDSVAPDGTIIQAHHYTRDRVGNVTALADDRPVSGEPTATAEYELDALYRLTSAHLDPGTSFDEVTSYAYDRLDNFVSKTSSLGEASPEHAGSYAYGQRPHAPVQVGERAITYDEAGDMTAIGDEHLEWDARGRITLLKTSDNDLFTFNYGAGPNRTIKKSSANIYMYFSHDYSIYNSLSRLSIKASGVNVAVESEIVPGIGALPDVAPDGRTNAADAYVWNGHATDTPYTTLQFLSASAISLLSGAVETSWQSHDMLTSSFGSSSYSTFDGYKDLFYPYGAPRQLNKSAFSLFTSREYEHDTDLIYYGFRFLLPEIGTWLRPDTALERLDDKSLRLFGGVNRFSFTNSNPISRIEVDGRFSDEALGYRAENPRILLTPEEAAFNRAVVNIGLHVVQGSLIVAGGCSTGIGCALAAGAATNEFSSAIAEASALYTKSGGQNTALSKRIQASASLASDVSAPFANAYAIYSIKELPSIASNIATSYNSGKYIDAARNLNDFKNGAFEYVQGVEDHVNMTRELTSAPSIRPVSEIDMRPIDASSRNKL